jgi:hypothetical protein
LDDTDEVEATTNAKTEEDTRTPAELIEGKGREVQTLLAKLKTL